MIPKSGTGFRKRSCSNGEPKRDCAFEAITLQAKTDTTIAAAMMPTTAYLSA